MGFIVDTGIDNLGIERRKESFYIYELDKTIESELSGKDSEIFAFGVQGLSRSPTLEITNDFLKKIVRYFNEHPEELNGVNATESEEDKN